MARCSSCDRPIKGAGFRSPMGRTVCRVCHDKITGGVVAGVTGGGITEAVTLAGNDPDRPSGALAWARRALRRKD